MLDDRAYLVRWEYSYSSWTLFTCEIEMLLHVVSTAGEVSLGGHDCGEEKQTCLELGDRESQDKTQNRPDWDPCSVYLGDCSVILKELLLSFPSDVIQHCQRVRPIIDLVHKVISTDLSIADCLLPITSRIYMLLQR